MPVPQQNPLVPKVAEAQHYTPLTARQLRAQAVHRLQIGFAGLAAMLLLVGLASIINDQLRRTDASPEGAVAASNAAAAAPKSDPLADIGVIPSPEADASPAKEAPNR